MTPENLIRILDARAGGRSIKQIAYDLGCTPSCVYQAIYRAGHHLRPAALGSGTNTRLWLPAATYEATNRAARAAKLTRAEWIRRLIERELSS